MYMEITRTVTIAIDDDDHEALGKLAAILAEHEVENVEVLYAIDDDDTLAAILTAFVDDYGCDNTYTMTDFDLPEESDDNPAPMVLGAEVTGAGFVPASLT